MISFLFVDSERVWRGGQDQLFTLLRGLIRRGHEVHLACHPRTLLEERARGVGIQVHPVNFRRGCWLIVFLRMLRVMRRIHPGILAFNTPRPILLCNLASRFSSVRARIIFRRVNFPLRRNPITSLKYSWGINCIVAISESIGHQLQASGVPGHRIRTVYEGMDLTLYQKREGPKRRRAGEPCIIGTVAYLSEEKGLRFLIEAASRIPEVQERMRFVIVGDGECRRKLENQVGQYGLQGCFHFTGFQTSTTSYFEQFDLFVLPSLSEGLSSAILTAMAIYLPVVATDVGGIPELIRHGENGLLVPAADCQALARAIEHLVDHPEEAFRMGLCGRKRVEEQFTLDRKILETEQLCLSLLQEGTSVSPTAHV